MPESRDGHVVLTADVGGTWARFALACDGRLLQPPQRLERARFPDLASACRHHLGGTSGAPRIDGAAIAAAGRVEGGRIAMTNADWSVDPQALAGELGLRPSRIRVLNDFAALAWVLPELGPDERVAAPGGAHALAHGAPPPGDPLGNRVVVGPGSGLGVAALLRVGDRWHPLATEGGHASVAVRTPSEHAALELAASRFGRVSWERLLSGPGLALLHESACAEAGLPPAGLDAAGVVEACGRGDPLALRAARNFVALLGEFAGDLALLYDATGGVTIAGGVLPSLAAVLPLDALRARFEDKGRFTAWLATVPVDVLASPFAALRGAAIAYRASSS